MSDSDFDVDEIASFMDNINRTLADLDRELGVPNNNEAAVSVSVDVVPVPVQDEIDVEAIINETVNEIQNFIENHNFGVRADNSVNAGRAAAENQQLDNSVVAREVNAGAPAADDVIDLCNDEFVFRNARPANVPANVSEVINLVTPERAPAAARFEQPWPFPRILTVPRQRRRSEQGNQIPVPVPLPFSIRKSPEPEKQKAVVETRKETELAYVCPICMESPFGVRKPTSTKCGHVFCEQCIKTAINISKKCPLCNTKLQFRHCHRLYMQHL